MFGFIQANMDALSEEEKKRYHSIYCGLCHTLGERYGMSSRLSLTYDLTFLTLLLNSLYEPESYNEKKGCIIHPLKKHCYTQNECTEYAADMTIALSYYKCLDDWNDDHNILKRSYALLLSNSYKKVKEIHPLKCGIIERELKILSEIEKNNEPSPDAGANSFGNLMGSVFVYKRDNWADAMYAFGYGLGRFIYIADAAVDLEHDKKRESYNPLVETKITSEELRLILKTILGNASKAFESLPLVQDVNLLRNILYSGIWIKYNNKIKKERNNG